MKAEKGTFGYIKAQKKKRTLITSVLFLIPIIIFLTGLHETGTRLNMFTFVAIMGCLPASRSAVGMVMMLMQKSTDPELYRQVEERAGDLVRAYELTISAYEKNTPVDSLVICGYHVESESGHRVCPEAYQRDFKRKRVPGGCQDFQRQKALPGACRFPGQTKSGY